MKRGIAPQVPLEQLPTDEIGRLMALGKISFLEAVRELDRRRQGRDG